MLYNVYIMIRKQLYITPVIDRTIKLLSMQERKSEAQIQREALEIGLDAKKRGSSQAARGLLKLAEQAVPGLPADLSAAIDRELYEHQ